LETLKLSIRSPANNERKLTEKIFLSTGELLLATQTASIRPKTPKRIITGIKLIFADFPFVLLFCSEAKIGLVFVIDNQVVTSRGRTGILYPTFPVQGGGLPGLMHLLLLWVTKPL
jgi:hypothetical protein